MSTLSDNEIRTRIQNGDLVTDGDVGQIGPACYELRMSSVYYDLTEDGKRIDAVQLGSVLIKPGHRVVLITWEKLSIPKNIIARVSSKGSLFSIGLSPVCTYADPGFSGNIGLVTQNLSDKYIEIPIGESLAKIDFSFLTSASSSPYQGQHGFHTKIWPIKSHFQKSYEDVKLDTRVESEEAESFKILPAATAKSIKFIQSRQKLIDGVILGSLFINSITLAYAIGDPAGVKTAIVVNLLSSAIAGAFSWFYRLKS